MLSDSLGIKMGLTAIIGGGGKTTLMLCLGRELSKHGRVIITTSAKIYPPENITTLDSPSENDIRKALSAENMICVGNMGQNGKLTPPDIPFERLTELADYVLCEADGSKGLPLKAHLPHEPVIPKNTIKTLCVLGISGMGRPAGEVCHRAERFAELAGIGIADAVTPQAAANVINAEGFGDVLVVNQARTAGELKMAKTLAGLCHIPVFAGEIRKGELECL